MHSRESQDPTDPPSGTPPAAFLRQRDALRPDISGQGSAKTDETDEEGSKFDIVVVGDPPHRDTPPVAATLPKVKPTRYRLRWKTAEGSGSWTFDCVESCITDVTIILLFPEYLTDRLGFDYAQPMMLEKVAGDKDERWAVTWCDGNFDFQSRGLRGIMLLKDNSHDDQNRTD